MRNPIAKRRFHCRCQTRDRSRAALCLVAVAWMLGYALPAGDAVAQVSSQPPQPPELPYLISDEPYRISDEKENASPIASLAPLNRDKVPLHREHVQGGTNKQPTTPILRAIDAHIREVEAAESRRLYQLKTKIKQFQTVLQEQRERADEEHLKAESARKGEQAAMQRAAESQELAIQARKREAEAREGCQAPDTQPADAGDPSPLSNPGGTPTLNLEAPVVGDTHSSESPQLAPQAAPQEFVPTPPPTMVTDSAVDQRALADNLFGAGEYNLAREIYEIMLGNDESGPDVAWFRYQVANCHRHLGNPQRAATHYRVVAADENATFLAENSKWWLASLEKKTDLQDRMAALTQVMEQVRQTTR